MVKYFLASGWSGYSGEWQCGPEPDSEPEVDLNGGSCAGDRLPFMYTDEGIPPSMVCDGCYDCVDASDELYCDSGSSGYSGSYRDGLKYSSQVL